MFLVLILVGVFQTCYHNNFCKIRKSGEEPSLSKTGDAALYMTMLGWDR